MNAPSNWPSALAATNLFSMLTPVFVLIGIVVAIWLALFYCVNHGPQWLRDYARRVIAGGRAKSANDFPVYGLYDSILTPNERPFYAALREAVGDRFTIQAKVRLEDVLRVPQYDRSDERARSKHTTARNHVSSRHIDFLLCDPATLRPILAIELDGPSHDRPKARHDDDIKNRALASAKLRLLRVKEDRKYQIEELRGQMSDVMGERATAPARTAVGGQVGRP